MVTTSVRAAEPGDLMDVARIWEQGWRDAHSGFVSPELVEARRGEAFVTRAEDRLASTLVAVADSAVVGFVVVIDDEVEQLYVDRTSRGAGVAAPLIAAAEDLIGRRGFERVWLAVIPENARARRFYEKCGWRDEGDFDYRAEGSDADITVRCRRYTKSLGDG